MIRPTVNYKRKDGREVVRYKEIDNRTMQLVMLLKALKRQSVKERQRQSESKQGPF